MVTKKIIAQIDKAVEKVDYTGGVEADVRLADLVSRHWPDLEELLLLALKARKRGHLTEETA